MRLPTFHHFHVVVSRWSELFSRAKLISCRLYPLFIFLAKSARKAFLFWLATATSSTSSSSSAGSGSNGPHLSHFVLFLDF